MKGAKNQPKVKIRDGFLTSNNYHLKKTLIFNLETLDYS